jgi:regulator of protease activity HflC (stomatin/prohibitin superfamily)
MRTVRVTPLRFGDPVRLPQLDRSARRKVEALLRRRGGRQLVTLVLALLAVAIIVIASGARFVRQDVGHVGVVRNGGPLDTRSIRQVLEPGARLTWIGWFSQSPREYPAHGVERSYTVASNASAGAPGSRDVFHVPTRDGVEVGIEGSVFYHFVGETDHDLLRAFDMRFGTRRFETTDGRQLYPWNGEAGFNAMLDTIMRPVLDTELRREVGGFRCAQLVTSCGLLLRGGKVGAGIGGAPVNIRRIEGRIATSLQRDLESTFRAPYFDGIRFRLAQVTLPRPVQSAIDTAQSEYADVSSSRARLVQARYDERRNRLLARTYNSSPALARIEAIRAAPAGATIIIGSGGQQQPRVLVGNGGGSATGATADGDSSGGGDTASGGDSAGGGDTPSGGDTSSGGDTPDASGATGAATAGDGGGG